MQPSSRPSPVVAERAGDFAGDFFPPLFFWLNVCPSAYPSEEGQISTFTMQLMEEVPLVRDRACTCVHGRETSGDRLKPKG